MNYYINVKKQPIKKVGDFIDEATNIYIAFTNTLPNAQNYVELLDSGILMMKDLGELQTLKKKYFSND